MKPFEHRYARCIKKGNPTLACLCALNIGCMDVIFAYSHKDQRLSCGMRCFLCHFGKNGTNRRTIKIVSRNKIFSLLVKIFIEPMHDGIQRIQRHAWPFSVRYKSQYTCMDALSRNIIYLSPSLNLLMTFPKANRLLFIKPPSFKRIPSAGHGRSFRTSQINQALKNTRIIKSITWLHYEVLKKYGKPHRIYKK